MGSKKKCEECIYGSMSEYEKPCIVYKGENCELYEKRGNGMTNEEAIKTLKGEVWINCQEKWFEALDMAIKALEQEPSGDLISREAVIDELNKWDWQELYLPIHFKENIIDILPSAEKTGHCKDCKYFEYDSVAKVDGIPLIVAHEICSRWGDGCKTKEDGYCFLFEPKESEDKE